MKNIIIYPDPDTGTICVCNPSGLIPAAEVARKDVPAGTPYFIISSDLLPDWWSQEAWEADWSFPDGYGIGHDAWIQEQEAQP
jgi:hypothetical protein